MTKEQFSIYNEDLYFHIHCPIQRWCWCLSAKTIRTHLPSHVMLSPSENKVPLIKLIYKYLCDHQRLLLLCKIVLIGRFCNIIVQLKPCMTFQQPNEKQILEVITKCFFSHLNEDILISFLMPLVTHILLYKPENLKYILVLLVPIQTISFTNMTPRVAENLDIMPFPWPVPALTEYNTVEPMMCTRVGNSKAFSLVNSSTIL